jgi:hypothetical protein
MRYEILFSNKFKKSFSKLEFNEKKLFYKKLSLFVENHLHPSFRTKKIQGSEILFESSINMSRKWTCSVKISGNRIRKRQQVCYNGANRPDLVQ